ncbi:NAC domain containing protein 52-like [Capsella rubella]|uniref:NAC domain containing protein 52-like n=1 Tax=Capsella rubella TaxID=81985 RepID=UPI000CD5A0A6|nr:NAC domain containing protein 52-like [Capsella rubella]
MDRDSKKPGVALPAATGNAAAETSLAPGFRFHPSDEELISYYLKRKVQGKLMRLDAIGEIDIYKHEPWNLAEHSKLKTRDKEWYFFSALDKKYSTGTSVKRTTKQGYWNVTGKDREIRRGDSEVIIGKTKILVFYKGRAPHGRRTNWVMHEYRLAEDNKSLKVNAYVLCKVFLKENPGECIGSRYAPFLEQEWDDDGERAVTPVPLVVQIDNNNKEHHDEALKRAPLPHCDLDKEAPLPHCDLDKEAQLPFCVLNKEATLPLVGDKRKRGIDSSGNSNSSSQTTQDHCASTEETSVDTGAAESLQILEQLKSSVANMIDDLQNEKEPVAKKVSASKRVEDLLKEKDKMVLLRKTQKREMMEAEMVINFLEDKIKTLCMENKELEKNKSNKRQRSS